MKETEITVQVFQDINSIIHTLEACGFAKTEEFVISDCYFTHIKCTKEVDYATLMKNSFLVRKIDCDNPHMELCYKNKQIDETGVVICEEKTKSPIIDYENTLSVFRLAGLNNYCNITNNSQIFKKDKVELAVQAVADLGIFIECEELPYMKSYSSEEKIKELSDIIKSLGLNLGTDFSCKKVKMMLDKL